MQKFFDFGRGVVLDDGQWRDTLQHLASAILGNIGSEKQELQFFPIMLQALPSDYEQTGLDSKWKKAFRAKYSGRVPHDQRTIGFLEGLVLLVVVEVLALAGVARLSVVFLTATGLATGAGAAFLATGLATGAGAAFLATGLAAGAGAVFLPTGLPGTTGGNKDAFLAFKRTQNSFWLISDRGATL